MKPFYDLIVVIPVGPNSSVEFINDTIESFTYYTASTYKIIIADDSHQGIATTIKKTNPESDIVYTKKNMGGMAGLYITLSLAYQHALTHYDFKALFKIDID